MSEPAAHDLKHRAYRYFLSPVNHFWHWADQGRVAEWRNQDTMCYREELQAVLEALAPTSLPPLGAVLLLLSACSDNWAEARASHWLFRAIKEQREGQDEELTFYRNTVLRFLNQVQALPRELRTGPAKLHLFREVLAGDNDWRELVQDLPPRGRSERRYAVLAEWTSGRLDALLLPDRLELAEGRLREELLCLDRAFQRFPSTEQLARHLRTGLAEVPAALPEPPAEPEPAAPAGDLLAQLSQDARTYGLARLTQRLVAALRIPPQAREASEQPLDGVADVTNRGNFDRLLLSELAHDDLTLLARLAGNEALYLRREAPPAQDLRPRLILLDTTLRLWGVPRVFGLAAALAWARAAQAPPRRQPVTAYALGGQATEALNLDSLTGVVAALSRLDAAPHAGAALTAFARSPAATDADCLLITAAELLTQPAFAAALAEARPALRFLLTVDRSGELQLYEYRGGQRQLLSTTRHDLDELLFAPMPARPAQPGHADEPAYLAQQPAPLFFPTTGLKITPKTSFFHPRLGLLGITEQQRVLFYPSREFGARELLPRIEPGSYYFGYDDAATVYVLVQGEAQPVFYAFDTQAGTVERLELAEDYPPTQPLTAVTYLGGCFYLCFGRSPSIAVTVFDCRRRHVAVRHGGPFPSPVRPDYYVDRGQLKQHVNSGYSVVQNVRLLGLSPSGELTIDGRALHLSRRQQDLSCHLKLRSLYPEEQVLRRVGRGHGTNLLDNPQLWLGHFAWPEGSQAWVDSRGLLHLRSADAAVPDITVLLVVDRATAAWAADGTVCGPEYFTGAEPARRLDPAAFYQQYIQRFIDRLLSVPA